MITWMDCRQYAEHIGSNVHMVQDLCKQQKITAIKLGVKWAIDADRADEDLLALGTKGFKRTAEMPTLNKAKENYLKGVISYG